MTQHSIFDVSSDQIAALDDEGLRRLIARLCEADLRRRRLPVTAVLYGGSQIAPDGGIDVRVELPADTEISGPIPRPITGFQAKAEVMPQSAIEEEMRPKEKKGRRKTSDRGPLRPSIAQLAADKGGYIIVSSKDSTTDSMLGERREAMSRAVADLDHREALHLDFYDRQRMATWVRDYPGEILWLRARIGQPLSGWRPFGNWIRVPDGVDRKYLSDDTPRLRDLRRPQDEPLAISDGIARLRSVLAAPGGIIRLTGLSGTGKTRLVEALFDPTIGECPLDCSWAVYADIGHETPQPSVGQLAEQLTAEGKRAVIVLDNCPRETHDAIASACRSRNGSLSLITVDLDICDEKPEDTDVFRLLNASETVMEALLERRFPVLSRVVCRRIAQFSEGNARVALLIAGVLKDEAPGANLADLGDEALFKRLFQQRKEENDALLRAAETLALVYSFDGEASQGNSAELPLLAEISGLEIPALFRAVGELSRRDIIQFRGRWRAILPQPLANWLAKRALANLAAPVVADAFWDHPRLLKSLAHRLSYLHDSPEARRIADAWLKPGGPLSDLGSIAQSWDYLRMDLVAYLASLAPAAVLDLIERFATGCEPEKLKSRALPHRQRLMTLLRKLAWFPEYFPRVVLTLARFIQAELTADTQTQETRYLEELFWPVLSGTGAGPQVRIAVLEELLSAPDPAARDTGIVALRGMLRAAPFTSSHDFSFGGHPVDYGWRPKTRADCEEWFGGALAIARRLALSNSPHRMSVRLLLAHYFRGLWLEGFVLDQLEQTASDIGAEEHWPEGWLAVRKTLALDAKRMEASLVLRLKGLKERLAPHSVEERTYSYVLVPAHEITNLAYWEADSSEGEAGEVINPVDGARSVPDRHQAIYKAVVEEARELGRHCARDPAPFAHLWTELLGPNGHQAYWFGQGFAQATTDIAASWAGLHERFRGCDPIKRNASLLGGFLEGAAATHRALVEGFLDDAIRDPDLGSVVPYLQIAAGLDQAGVGRLLASLEVGLAPPRLYRNLFGRTTDTIPPAELSRLLLVLSRRPEGYQVAVNILRTQFGDPQGNRGPWDPGLLDCGRQLLLNIPLANVEQNVAYDLGVIARMCLVGADTVADAQTLCERIRDAARDWRAPWNELDDLVKALLELHPHVALSCWLGGGTEDWTNITRQFLSITSCNPLGAVPTSTLLNWANQAPGIRYPRLAAAISPFDKEEEDGAVAWSEAALAFLSTAPDREAVFRVLVITHFQTVWPDSRADLLEQQRLLIRQFQDDRDSAVSRAAQDLDIQLQKKIASERTRERDRDERFE
ncbi:MAG: ATP-binding protein [Methylotetracoccus sp.]|jgi:hypothetical protein|nr:ATP-binding protein [Methylotetracoccus sp.]